jgi:predicted aminopeptidase
MVKKVILFLVSILLALAIWQSELIGYAWAQAKGQLSILWNAKPIEDYLSDPNFKQEYKDKIMQIQEIRRFAMDSLGLKNSDNYTTIYDQQGQDILWNVSASNEFKLQAYQWKFPILGSFGYKGFFDIEKAEKEKKRLDSLSYDTHMYSVSAWSTLGWFKDPILSNMLDRNEGQLADLILHELTHSTVFVKDSLVFNENLASFVGHIGAIAFLKYKYPNDSMPAFNFKNRATDYSKYLNHMMLGAKKLDSLYSAIENLELKEKRLLKVAKIEEIVNSIDTVSFSNKARFAKVFENELPNNAQLMSYLRYHSYHDLLEQEYINNFNADIKAYILHLKDRYEK